MLLTGLAVGVVLGFVFQRGRFCVTGAFRDVWLSRSLRWLTAFLVAVTIQAVIVNVLIGAGIIHPEIPKLALLGVAAGSFLFGIGIVLAGGCATGTYYRSGEGLIGSWIALGLYAFTASVMKFGAGQQITDSLRDTSTQATTIHGTLGVPVWVPLGLLSIVTIALVARQLSRPAPSFVGLPAKRTGLAHLLLEKPWAPLATAVVVGLIAAAAFPLSEAAGRPGGLGITTPSAKIVQMLTAGDVSTLDWGVLFVLGLIPGSYIAAKASGEFRLRAPDARTAVRAVIGGVLMGAGAAIAGGCTIGNSLVETALFSWQGWIAFMFTFLGVGAASRLFIVTHRRVGAEPVRLQADGAASDKPAVTLERIS
ncbi:YeeE/YedE family protein [Helcobacillus massiliensis]|uniref:YeeE/YedE family protein n=1 Tax=Helcobacillus massiliensis TaxID=521392 RepID=UPI0021A72764|nr:YeeE/YedE family protein [Helcobacillus massiliensis]MCT1558584.1 YeeE/YedE family protein [Helcobacillus massiliensis]MCT2332408.1 YeeE/YedE family protein [Helcobacillus massiliensis]